MLTRRRWTSAWAKTVHLHSFKPSLAQRHRTVMALRGSCELPGISVYRLRSTVHKYKDGG